MEEVRRPWVLSNSVFTDKASRMCGAWDEYSQIIAIQDACLQTAVRAGHIISVVVTLPATIHDIDAIASKEGENNIAQVFRLMFLNCNKSQKPLHRYAILHIAYTKR